MSDMSKIALALEALFGSIPGDISGSLKEPSNKFTLSGDKFLAVKESIQIEGIVEEFLARLETLASNDLEFLSAKEKEEDKDKENLLALKDISSAAVAANGENLPIAVQGNQYTQLIDDRERIEYEGQEEEDDQEEGEAGVSKLLRLFQEDYVRDTSNVVTSPLLTVSAAEAEDNMDITEIKDFLGKLDEAIDQVSTMNE